MNNSLQRKHVLVTGSAGVIGRELLKRLVKEGALCLSVDRYPLVDEGIEEVLHLQKDLSSENLQEVVEFEPEIVFHLAGSFERTEETVDFWISNFVNNVLSSHRVLELLKECHRLQCLILASSYLLYDPILYLDVPETRYLKEQDPVAPRNLVGVAKYFTERETVFLAKGNSSWRAVSARIFRVYGCGSRDVISRWIRSGLRGDRIQVYGQENRFDYIYAGDVAEGLLRLAESSKAQGVVNLGSGISRSIGEILYLLRHALENFQSEEVKWQGPREDSCADMSLFKQFTDWTPSTNLEEGVGQVLAHEKRKLSCPS